eukprot:CAMPEP_0116871164 /NCGR_PEP_ID=MMETSP0463-20121206/1389_1 /TAXON_ID=181622 /ORGANISM="Strombidinopsis sp, Strain SopsisLIS2011" /LENGTH=67 /DNA_ID=CAMNT_0004509061 /DNA_START=1423 /DNA_END=1626 /DNA_ORIENTATION=-
MEIEDEDTTTTTTNNDARLQVPIFLKYALRCLTSCIRSTISISVLVNDTNGLVQVLEFLEYSKDEEV